MSAANTMSVSHMNSHAAFCRVRKLSTTWLRAVEMFGPDWNVRMLSSGVLPSSAIEISDAQNSARTVPPCT